MIQQPTLRVRRDAGITIFDFLPPDSVFQDVDVHRFRQQFLDAVHDSGDERFIVDFSRVQYMDSTVLGVLVSALMRIQARGGQLRITGATRDLADLFRLTALHRVFKFADSLDQARKSFAKPVRVHERAGHTA